MEKQLNKNEERRSSNCSAPSQEKTATTNIHSEKKTGIKAAKWDKNCWRCNEKQENCKCNIKAPRDSPVLSIRFLNPELPLDNAIVVWNLSNLVTEESFTNLMQNCGKTEKVYFIDSDKNGPFRIYAYVQFEEGKDANKALITLDKKILLGMRVNADWFTKL